MRQLEDKQQRHSSIFNLKCEWIKQSKGRDRLDFKRYDLPICCLQETHFGFKDTNRLEQKDSKQHEAKKNYQKSWNDYTKIKQNIL